MNTERYIIIDRKGEGLTLKEIEEGWHFCHDWDYLLVGPGMIEEEFCSCKSNLSGNEKKPDA